MSVIHFDYVMGCTAIDIVVLLTCSIAVVAEMHRNRPPHRTVVTKRWPSPHGQQTLTIDDRTRREPTGVRVINYGMKL